MTVLVQAFHTQAELLVLAFELVEACAVIFLLGVEKLQKRAGSQLQVLLAIQNFGALDALDALSQQWLSGALTLELGLSILQTLLGL